MVEKVPSLKGGGAYWFTDLTTPDDLLILPVLTSLSFLATVEVLHYAAVIQVFYLLFCFQDIIFYSSSICKTAGKEILRQNH